MVNITEHKFFIYPIKKWYSYRGRLHHGIINEDYIINDIIYIIDDIDLMIKQLAYCWNKEP